jgi:hypothetical protein
MQNNHFLYRHVRVDTSQVFYVGIGTKKSFFTEYINKNFKNFKKYILNVISGKRKSAFSFNWKYITDISQDGADGQAPNAKPNN